MSKLLIVESPAKCQKIRGFLGADWNVCATMGHLRALEESLETLGVGTTFQAKYHWLKEKDKAIQKLKSAAQEAQEIFLAADDDREGEMIAYSVCVLLRLSPDKTPRIVFHEITETAIRHALEHPRALDMNRVYAQQARAMLDMMIGFTMSPLLWKYVAPTLSAGRCQTPALRLVIERENNIESFVTSRSWIMNATWSLLSSSSSHFLHTTMMDELEDEESIQQVLEHAHEMPYGKIAKKEIVRWSESAPDPLITSTLQQQASQLYHCSPKQTMCIAQRLYEAGHITYMRTDKAVMSEEAKTHAREWVKQNLGEEYIQEQRHEQQDQSSSTTRMKVKRPQTKKKENKNQNAQEAHEAIRPTHMEVTVLPLGEWGPVERNIYQLISRRAIQSVMAAAYGERCLITVEMEGLDDFPWRSEEKRTLFEGWKRMGRVAEIDDQEGEEKKEDEKSEWSGSLWNEGDQVKWVRMSGEEKETKSQGRFTEASLVRELEKHGIGRPSTFASLLSVIQEKRYVEVQDIPASILSMKVYTLESGTWPYTCQKISQKRGGEKRKLVPTPLGRSVWEWLSHHFEDIFAYGFTGDMEQKLDEIAEGKKEEKELLREIWESYRDRYETLKAQQHNQHNQQQQQISEDGPKRKIFKGGLKALQTKKGPLLLREGETKDATEFFGWPKGVSWDKMTEQKAIEYIESRKKEKEEEFYMEWLDQPVVKKSGPYGAYLQWDGISIPWIASESEQETGERLEKKKTGGSFQMIKETSRFMVRNGQYGPYITTKTKTKTKMVCVSISKDLVVDGLTDKELEALYKAGIEKKKGVEKKKGMEKKRDKRSIEEEKE